MPTTSTRDFPPASRPLTANRNLVAVAVASPGERPSIGVYDVAKSRAVRQLTVPAQEGVDEFVRLQFSCDDLYLAALSGHPDNTMYYVKWSQAVVDSHVRVVRRPVAADPHIRVRVNNTGGIVHLTSAPSNGVVALKGSDTRCLPLPPGSVFRRGTRIVRF